MRMGRASLQAQRLSWLRKEKYRLMMFRWYRDRSKRADKVERRQKWWRLLEQAREHLASIDRQLAGPGGPKVMYDSITPDTIPANAPAVAGYTAGHWPTYPVIVKKFPHARHVSIAVASRYDADCLDVEPGDATPEVAAGWFNRQRARGVRVPKFYCSVSSAPQLIGVLAKAGIQRGEYSLWTAHYTGREHVCNASCGFGFTGSADATQWTDKALGRNLDQSLCNPSFWR